MAEYENVLHSSGKVMKGMFCDGLARQFHAEARGARYFFVMQWYSKDGADSQRQSNESQRKSKAVSGYGRTSNCGAMEKHGNDMTSKGIGKLSFTEQWHCDARWRKD